MHFLWETLRQALSMIGSGDHGLVHLVWVTLEVAAVSTAAALLFGLPLGLALGLQRFRGRNAALSVANAGLGLPPVVLGVFVSLILLPAAPLGSLRLLYTLKGIYLVQALLEFPIVVALTAAAVQSVPAGLIDQARAFGAGTLQIWGLALREARIGVLAATIAAVGSALSEVGAIVLVGGNIEGYDQTLAGAALEEIGAGHYPGAMAIGIVLLGLILIVSAALTLVQQPGVRLRVRAPS